MSKCNTIPEVKKKKNNNNNTLLQNFICYFISQEEKESKLADLKLICKNTFITAFS